MRLLILAAVATASLVPTAVMAQSMNAEEFYQRAVKLRKKGPLALMSSDLKPLMTEGQAAGKAAAAARKQAVREGRPQRYCPTADAKMGQNEYLELIGRIPQPERRKIDMTEATQRAYALKFPCAR